MIMSTVADAPANTTASRTRQAWPAAENLPPLSVGDSVHLVGIGGAGMSGLARVMLARGLEVSGCDREASAVLDDLQALGADVKVGHQGSHVTAATALVVASPAIPALAPDLAAAALLGIGVTKRAVLLGALLDAETGVAVAGTHGKSTTTAMIAVVLVAAGFDPTVFVGADVPELGGNARHGTSGLVVIEADEYDRSFHHGHPAVAVVTSMEHDHPDMFPEFDDVSAAFRGFAEHVRPDGLLIVWAGEPALRRIADVSLARQEWFAVAGDPVVPDDVDWAATDLQPVAGGSVFEVWHRGTALGRWRITLPGRHNVANALAAIAATHHLGVPTETARAALATFGGLGRRFEVVADIGGVTLVDDYAHHPTEVAATVAAARERFSGRRLWVIFQPHTFSRLEALRQGFADALHGADIGVVVPVFGARESGPFGEAAAGLAALAGARFAGSLDAAADMLVEEAIEGDVVIIMGAGDVQRVTRRAQSLLSRREALRLSTTARSSGLGGDVIRGGRLSEHTSLRVGGAPALLVRCAAHQDLVGWWQLAQGAGISVTVLGRGSNVLAADDGFDGVVLINRCERWEIGADGPNRSLVAAESGVTLAALGSGLGKLGWSGLEPAAGIPGSVGAAVVNNSGAHGWCMADSVEWVEVADTNGVARLSGADLEFRYRGSALKGRRDRLVVRVGLAMTRDEPAAIAARTAVFQAQRRATQPTTPSVGSMFVNPAGDFAGRLIEAAGLKGTRIGGAMISDVHANFFVNAGGATAADMAALIALTRRTVAERFGVTLELEIEEIGGSNVA